MNLPEGLIEFKRLPDESTPATPEAINHNFEYLKDKFTNSIISNQGIITSIDTNWGEKTGVSITVPKGKYIVVGVIIGMPSYNMNIRITNTDATTIYSAQNSYGGRVNIVDIASFNSNTTLELKVASSSAFSNADISCRIKAIKISD